MKTFRHTASEMIISVGDTLHGLITTLDVVPPKRVRATCIQAQILIQAFEQIAFNEPDARRGYEIQNLHDGETLDAYERAKAYLERAKKLYDVTG